MSGVTTATTAGLVARRDLTAAWRGRAVAAHVIPFALVGLMLFAFALDAEPRLLTAAGPGLFWVIVLFAGVVVTQRITAEDADPSLADNLRLSGLSPAGVYLGRTAAMVVQMIVLEAVLLVAATVWFRPDWSDPALLTVAALTGAVGSSAASCVYGHLGPSTRGATSLLPILALPAQAPLLLGGARAFDAAAGRGTGGWAWVALMGVFAVSYCLLGAVVYGPLLEDA